MILTIKVKLFQFWQPFMYCSSDKNTQKYIVFSTSVWSEAIEKSEYLMIFRHMFVSSSVLKENINKFNIQITKSLIYNISLYLTTYAYEIMKLKYMLFIWLFVI